MSVATGVPAAVALWPDALGLVVLLGLAAIAVGLAALLVWRPRRLRLGQVVVSGRAAWTPTSPPYPGLAAFTEADAPIFAGREAEIAALLDRLERPARDAEERFLPVVGPPGIGKSSLVRAGLLARLRDDRRWLTLPAIELGEQPVDSLARALTAGEHEGGPAALPGPGAEALARRVGELRRQQGRPGARVLLVVDSADELLADGDAEREAFLNLLSRLLGHDRGLWIVATLRSASLDLFLSTPSAGLFAAPLAVGPLDERGLGQAVLRPAALAGLQIAPELVPRLAADARSTGALPLLAHTLRALYEQAGPGGAIDLEDYKRLGGVQSALVRQADALADRLQSAVGRAAVLATLLRFASVGEWGVAVRGIRRADLYGGDLRVVDAFLEAGLLRSSGQGADAVVAPAGDSLFRHWPPLRQEVDVLAEDVFRRAALERWAQEWIASDRHASYLLTGDRLRAAQQWAADVGDGLQELPDVADLLGQSSRLDRDAMQRLSETVAEQAVAGLDRDPERSVLLALAVIEECAPTPAAQRALVRALASRGLKVLRSPEAAVEAVAWSPDGSLLAAAAHDGSVRVWDAQRGDETLVLRGHEGPVLSVAWAPEGRRVATASEDGSVRVWDAAGGGQLTVLARHDGAVSDAVWSPDGRCLATVATAGAATVWTVDDGAAHLALRGHGSAVRKIAWSPSGEVLLTTSVDRTARLWDARSGGALAILRGHDQPVESAAWSPDGKWIVTASSDGTARVWNAGDGRELTALAGHDAWVLDAAWSPDGRFIATASADRTARIWDAVSGAQLAVLSGHGDEVRSVSWSPDGHRLATASWDQTVRLWDTDPGLELGVFVGHEEGAWRVAWSPDGRRLATASSDGSARIWDAERAAADRVLAGHGDEVRGVSWSPDGRRLATASWDRTVLTWDTQDGAKLAVLRLRAPVHNAAWSPDGTRIVTASDENVVWVWDAEESRKVIDLRGHDEAVVDVAWSPDGRRLATASRDHTVRVWAMEDGSQLALLRGHRGRVSCVGWSPDGRRLATASWDQTARVWDAVTGRELVVATGHEGPVNAVAWSPDGRRIATGSDDRTLRLWDSARGAELPMMCVHVASVTSVSWSRDGRRLATASLNGTAQTWDAASSLEVLVGRARSRVTRALTDEERRAAGLPEPTRR